jgi:hypothetical protein
MHTDPGHGMNMPMRPDRRSRQQRRERPWLPVIALSAVIAIATMGGYVVAALLATPAGAPVGFPGLVSLQPLAGWVSAGPGSANGKPTVVLTRGNGNLVVVDWGSTPSASDGLADEVVDELLVPSFTQLSVSERPEAIALDDGTPGSMFTFVGIDPRNGGPVEGHVVTVVDEAGHGVVFLGLAPEGQLRFVDGDLTTMIDRAEVI